MQTIVVRSNINRNGGRDNIFSVTAGLLTILLNWSMFDLIKRWLIFSWDIFSLFYSIFFELNCQKLYVVFCFCFDLSLFFFIFPILDIFYRVSMAPALHHINKKTFKNSCHLIYGWTNPFNNSPCDCQIKTRIKNLLNIFGIWSCLSYCSRF